MTTFVADPTCTNVYSSNNYEGNFFFNDNQAEACEACGTDNSPPTIKGTFLQNGYSPVNEYLENLGNTGSFDCSCSNTGACDVDDLKDMGFQAYDGQLYISNSQGSQNPNSGLTDHSTAEGACDLPLTYPGIYKEFGFTEASCTGGTVQENFEFPNTSYFYIILIIGLVLVLAVCGFFIYKGMNAPKIPLKMSGGRKKRV